MSHPVIEGMPAYKVNYTTECGNDDFWVAQARTPEEAVAKVLKVAENCYMGPKLVSVEPCSIEFYISVMF
jgi:predicted nucleic-acid-binding Zn-ribbon protein